MGTNTKAETKKLTLIAWTKILLQQGRIDIKKYNRMVEIFNKIT